MYKCKDAQPNIQKDRTYLQAASSSLNKNKMQKKLAYGGPGVIEGPSVVDGAGFRHVSDSSLIFAMELVLDHNDPTPPGSCNNSRGNSPMCSPAKPKAASAARASVLGEVSSPMDIPIKKIETGSPFEQLILDGAFGRDLMPLYKTSAKNRTYSEVVKDKPKPLQAHINKSVRRNLFGHATKVVEANTGLSIMDCHEILVRRLSQEVTQKPVVKVKKVSFGC